GRRRGVTAAGEPAPAKRPRIAALAPPARWPASAAAVLGAEDADAVVIASPAATHVELALAALAAGKHVLIEKPLARRLGDARRVAAAARPGTVAMVGHLMVFHPAVRRIRELLGSAGLGRPFYVHAMRVNLG